MRIQSLPNRNINTAFKSEKRQKKHNQDNNSSTNSESLELSDEAKLLNNLLHATINQFNPYPFYFTNAAARNINQAYTISKNIQNQAESMDVLLNYAMIYDMVINLATQKHFNKIQWDTTITAEYEALSNEEKMLFENLHNACQENQTPVNIIESAALKYIQLKQTKLENLPNRRECAQFVVDCLKEESILSHNDVKKSLSAIIKQYINPTSHAEPH